MKKALVAYFSASGEKGTTAQLAAQLAGIVGAETYGIAPQVPYTPADLDWRDANSRTTVEMNNRSFRPAIADADAPVADCDVVFLGFPIWWYVAPTIVNTFLEAYDFAGKTIVPFATSGGSDLGDTVAELAPSAPGATFAAGALLNGPQSDEALRAWVEELGL